MQVKNVASIGQLSDADLRLLRVFKAVVDCGGMAAAELELNIGTSTISRHIKDLETRLGLVLSPVPVQYRAHELGHVIGGHAIRVNEGAKAATGTGGCSSWSRLATTAPVIGPLAKPIWPWPKAKISLGWRAARPMTGSPSGVNPQGCQVHSFKAPGPMELDHDFLWRHSIALPERGAWLSVSQL